MQDSPVARFSRHDQFITKNLEFELPPENKSSRIVLARMSLWLCQNLTAFSKTTKRTSRLRSALIIVPSSTTRRQFFSFLLMQTITGESKLCYDESVKGRIMAAVSAEKACHAKDLLDIGILQI